MKRRNVEPGKMRRPLKRNKITEGLYGNTLLYGKFFVLWTVVIFADFMLDFRFEFLWPFYLLLRSVYDSFKYQGLAFSALFVCVAITSDMIAFFFIPVNWLFFAASTYVWVQYVWHTDRGFCSSTVVLCLMCVYLEAAIRLKDDKYIPFHVDLCRPFAAHCIGYPVVTLGFGFKSYVGFRMRQKRQKEVQKENEFYMQLLQQALPNDEPVKEIAQTVTNAATVTPVAATATVAPVKSSQASHNTKQHQEKNGHGPCLANGSAAKQQTWLANGSSGGGKHQHRKSVEKSKEQSNGHIATSAQQPASHTAQQHQQASAQSEDAITRKRLKDAERESREAAAQAAREAAAAKEAAEYVQRLELDLRRLRVELQTTRSSEQDLRAQLSAASAAEKVARSELAHAQRDRDELQARAQAAQAQHVTDRQTIATLERRVADERRTRNSLESQLTQERKQQARKVEELRVRSSECTDACKARRRELETELQDAHTHARWAEERCRKAELDLSTLAEQQHEIEVLMSALAAMQDKNQHLENSLSAETRIKLDLFSALGEARRQLEIRDTLIRTREKEIDELKSRIAQVLAVMPSDSFGGPQPTATMSRVRLAETVAPPGSNLDPNATAYTPKGSLVTSTEA